MKQIYLCLLWLGGVLSILLPSRSFAQEESFITISDKGNEMWSGSPMNWRLETSRSQSYYPVEMLNLPVGTLISSVSFKYNTYGTQSLGSGGDIKVFLGETSSIPSFGSSFLEGLQLVYSGTHQMEITSNYDKVVKYSFSTPYEYRGGILVIEVSNMDSPRKLSSNVDVSFALNPYFENVASVYMENETTVNTVPGVPFITIGFKQKDSSPILYMPFSERTVVVGSISGNEIKQVSIPISNLGKGVLKTEAVNGPLVSASAVDIPAQSNKNLIVQINPKPKSSFNESVTLNSNGGKVELTFVGTTYQLRRANTIVDLDKGENLQNIDSDITELSVVGYLDYSDWRYIYYNFRNLRYLDLSGAITSSNSFPYSFYKEPMVCASTLERLCLPGSPEYLSGSMFSRLGLTALHDIILPPVFKRIDGNASSFSDFSFLENLISLAPTPPYVDQAIIAKFAHVYVPENVKTNYRNDYAWNQSDLSEITTDVLNGNEEGEVPLEFTGDGEYSSELIINWDKEITHTQVLYPAKWLNIPKGTLIKSIKLRFELWGDQASNGTMKISCAEKNYEKVDGFITDGQVCYEGSDNLDCSLLKERQAITYEFKQPYEYKGEGDLVLCFESKRPSSSVNNTNVSTAFNQIEGIHCWSPWDGESFYETDQKPDITLNVKLNGEEPYLFIPLKSRTLYCGYAPMGESSLTSLPVRNLGNRELSIDNLSCYGNASFTLDVPVTIPAHSSQFINIRYASTLGSVVEKGLLTSTGGSVDLKLIGTSLRQAPYEKNIKNIVIKPGTTLRNLISENLNGADWGEITELSVTGVLSEEDVRTLRELPNLRLLDLSTAIVASEESFRRALYDIAPQLEQLALPLNLSVFDLGQGRLSNLTKLILPVGLRSLWTELPEQLTSLILLSPEPPEMNGMNTFLQFLHTIYVPENVIESYRTNPWNLDQREILPITDEILSTDWTGGPIWINTDQVYDESSHPGGTPDILILPDYEKGDVTASLWNKADLTMKSLVLGNQLRSRSGWSEDGLFKDWSSYASFINESDRATADAVGYALEIEGGSWYYLSFPFDFVLKDITMEPSYGSGEYVFRSYDGASRAMNGLDKQNNWKDVQSSETLKAGQGYIFQGENWSQFLMFTNSGDAIRDFMATDTKTIPMEEHAITDPEKIDDKNWNFMGNPYPSFFNIRYIENYTAPIIIWNGEGYIALSAQDDNYALRPLEAFFTQKPDGVSEMTFNTKGRQINPDIINPVEFRVATISPRRVINLRFIGKSYTDRSRVIINPSAKEDYELAFDAVKWMSPNVELPQLYTLDGTGHHYAINERPQGSGGIPLGIYVGVAGEYTLEIPKEERGQSILLVDKYRNKEMDLSMEAYTFYADEGTFDDRFELRVSSIVTSSGQIDGNEIFIYAQNQLINIQAPVDSEIRVYSATGIQLISEKMTQDTWSRSFPAGIYLVRVEGKTQKLIIH